MNKTQFLAVTSRMPPLRHATTTPFDIMASPLVDWLVAQPEIRQWVFDRVRTGGGLIYNPETGKWTAR